MKIDLETITKEELNQYQTQQNRWRKLFFVVGILCGVGGIISIIMIDEDPSESWWCWIILAAAFGIVAYTMKQWLEEASQLKATFTLPTFSSPPNRTALNWAVIGAYIDDKSALVKESITKGRTAAHIRLVGPVSRGFTHIQWGIPVGDGYRYESMPLTGLKACSSQDHFIFKHGKKEVWVNDHDTGFDVYQKLKKLLGLD